VPVDVVAEVVGEEVLVLELVLLVDVGDVDVLVLVLVLVEELVVVELLVD
jgi:hypothetical protein